MKPLRMVTYNLSLQSFNSSLEIIEIMLVKPAKTDIRFCIEKNNKHAIVKTYSKMM